MENFQYPGEWDQAGDAWSQMASGNYSNAGTDWLTNMMNSGGNAFDVSGWDAMYRPQMMDQYSNAVKQMAEQAGMGGVRYGSGLQNSIANYGGQLQNQYTKDLWDRMYGAYESGQNRAAGAGGYLGQFGLEAQGRGAEGLMSLGNYRSQLPLQTAQTMGNLAMNQTAQQVDPWTQMMAQYIGGTGQAYPQTYTPSGFQSFFQNAAQNIPGALDTWDQQGWWGGQ
jgi:hypothetical protein